jgi:20S proteasome alpha/beta subunit
MKLSSCLLEIAREPADMYRTDNATLATNGFAADGKNFVKRVKQRLEVSCNPRMDM